MSITYNEIVKVNESIKTTNIKGKEYAEVNQRIKAFRMLYPQGYIETLMLSNDNGVVVFRAEVGYYEDGKRVQLAAGTAYEREGASMINKTSYIENCETSAVGRALGMAGFGIDTSVASYEEVATAIANQDKEFKPFDAEAAFKKKSRVEIVKEIVEAKGLDNSAVRAKVIELFGAPMLVKELSTEQFDVLVEELRG